MKRIIFILSLFVIAAAVSAYRHAISNTEDVFGILGISREEAHLLMKENILFSSLSTPDVSRLRRLPLAKRAEIVKTLGTCMKTYCQSKEVQDAYRDYRKTMLPGNQEGIDIPARIDEIRRDIRKTEEEMKSAPGNLKDLYTETITQLKRQLQALQDPSHPDHQAYSGIVALLPEQQQEIDRQIVEFNKEYPESFHDYLKIKLRHFLDLTAHIDFDARLIKRQGRLVFENPVYEAKDPHWKKCFRAGKETISAARAFAKDWLAEMP